MATTYQRDTRLVRAADGTQLAYHWHVRRSTGTQRRAILLTNGIGTTENFWKHLVDELTKDQQVVHWDFRGHGRSENAASGAYDLSTLADDLHTVTGAVMQATSGLPPIHLAFSLGVPVLLQMYKREPARVHAAILLAGSSEPPFAFHFPLRHPLARRVLGQALKAADALVPVLAPPTRLVLKSPLVYPLGRLSGVLRPRAPKDDVRRMMDGIAAMDLRAYVRTLQGLFTTSVSDVLPSFDVPALVIAAAQDRFIPASQVRRLASALPHADYAEVQDAGHAGLVEAGPELAQHVRLFVDRIASGNAVLQ